LHLDVVPLRDRGQDRLVETFDPPIACKRSPLAVAARIAGLQHGVVARRQLVRAGLSRRAVDHLIGTGSLLPLYRGVYAVGHRPVGVRSREMAVVLMGGVRALAWQSALRCGRCAARGTAPCTRSARSHAAARAT